MGIKERKLREHEKRKALILDTAKQLFTRKGFVNVTLEDIAKEIEYSKGIIYSHFKSKEELYAQILLEQLNALLNFLKEAVEASQNTKDGIKLCLDAYMKFYSQHKEYFQLLFFIDMVSSHYRIPLVLIKAIQAKKHACFSELEYLLRKGKESQELGANLLEKNVSMALWGMLNGLLQLAELRQIKDHELNGIINIGFDIVINGLIGKENKLKDD